MRNIGRVRALRLNIEPSEHMSLNQQMLESMKRYLRKLEKNKAIFAKRPLEPLNYGLDIKSIESRPSHKASDMLAIKYSSKNSQQQQKS